MVRCAVIASLKTFRDSFAFVEIATGREHDGGEVGNMCAQHFLGAHVLEVSLNGVTSSLARFSGGVELVVGSLDFVFTYVEGILDALVCPHNDPGVGPDTDTFVHCGVGGLTFTFASGSLEVACARYLCTDNMLGVGKFFLEVGQGYFGEVLDFSAVGSDGGFGPFNEWFNDGFEVTFADVGVVNECSASFVHSDMTFTESIGLREHVVGGIDSNIDVILKLLHREYEEWF